jgi:branched-subunit amino acid ABC-type transport system permease component
MLGLLVQIRPFMGFDLLLPLFAVAILGGIGSALGAFAGLAGSPRRELTHLRRGEGNDKR